MAEGNKPLEGDKCNQRVITRKTIKLPGSNVLTSMSRGILALQKTSAAVKLNLKTGIYIHTYAHERPSLYLIREKLDA